MGGEELKWHQLKHNQIMSPQGQHFSPHKKICLKKCMMIMIIIIMIKNLSQETTGLGGGQKLRIYRKKRRFLAGARN